jgi:hypothetical protein
MNMNTYLVTIYQGNIEHVYEIDAIDHSQAREIALMKFATEQKLMTGITSYMKEF